MGKELEPDEEFFLGLDDDEKVDVEEQELDDYDPLVFEGEGVPGA